MCCCCHPLQLAGVAVAVVGVGVVAVAVAVVVVVAVAVVVYRSCGLAAGGKHTHQTYIYAEERNDGDIVVQYCATSRTRRPVQDSWQNNAGTTPRPSAPRQACGAHEQ